MPVIDANGNVIGQHYVATGYFDDGSTRYITRDGQWASTNDKVFTIDDDGLAMFTGKGTGELVFMYGALNKFVYFTV